MGAAAVLGIALAFSGAMPAVAHGSGGSQAGSHRPVVSHMMIPLTGAFPWKDDACVTGESITLSGRAHVVTIVRPSGATLVHVNLANVVGTGTSGDTYIGVGAHTYRDQTITSNVWEQLINFRLVSTAGCASQILPLTVTLGFSNSGLLLKTSTVAYTPAP